MNDAEAIQAVWESWARLLTAEEDKTQRLTEALRAIQIRCREGDPRSDWLPTIERLASAALGERET